MKFKVKVNSPVGEFPQEILPFVPSYPYREQLPFACEAAACSPAPQQMLLTLNIDCQGRKHGAGKAASIGVLAVGWDRRSASRHGYEDTRPVNTQKLQR